MTLATPKWEIRGHVLGLSGPGNKFSVPKASELFPYLFSGRAMEGDFQAFNTVREDVPDVTFSRLGSRIELHFSQNANERGITCSAVVKKTGKIFDVTDALIAGIDHVVFERKWFDITENFDQVRSFLADCGVSDVAHVPYSAYLTAIRKSSEYPGVSIKYDVRAGCRESNVCTRTPPPPELHATLYPYQEEGYSWLKFVTDENCGCILGDEMGLGKTLQVITLLLDRKNANAGRPSLVVAPVSLLENWRRELARFAPSLRVLIHHGAGRSGFYRDLLGHDVVVVSYTTTINDSVVLGSIDWDILVADEAQNIKSPYATRTKYIKKIQRRATIAMSGTPFENHISDIWSVVDFVLPSFLGNLPTFLKEYPDTLEGADRIEPLLSPIMMRRLVKDVAQDLPEKIEIPIPLIMTQEESEQYERERERIAERIGDGNTMFAELSGLRMYCTHPSLSRQDSTPVDPIQNCTKYDRLCSILEEIKGQNEKVILFTSFVGMCDLLQRDIPARLGIPVRVINGATPVANRQSIIDQFGAAQGCTMLVLNPRAAATGLNITAANHVIHYNLEWNPALEDQASARAYRRGQTKTVFVHRMFYIRTVEEFVNDKIRTKRSMSDAAVVGNIGDVASRQDYLDALTYSPMRTEERND